MATTTTSERSIEDIVRCLRTKMDYDEFRDLAPHLRVKLQNSYYEQFSKAEKEYANTAPNIETALADVACGIFVLNIERKFKNRPLVDSFSDAEELFATLLWKCGEADARGDNMVAHVYNTIYDAIMLSWRNEVLYADSMRKAFALDFDEEAWAKNIDGRVYWEQKIREIAAQLVKEEV